MGRMIRVLLLLCCAVLISDRALATTYYVDITNGADTNPGTSKTAAWAHAPGMQTCTSVCASTTINPGDSIILRGGETWPNASFEWALPGGSSSSPVYIGVDTSWYAGSSWARPILNAGGVVIANNYDTMFTAPSYVTFDNFEITGFYWGATTCSGAPYGDCGIFNNGQRSGQTFEHLYIHGWTHAGTDHTSTAGVSMVFMFGGNGQNTLHDSVIVGTDVPGDHSIAVGFNGPGTAYNNYIQQVSSAFIVSNPEVYYNNYIEDIGPAYCNEPFPQYAGNCAHENGFEDNGDTGLYFYNNVITNINGGLALWIAPYPGYSAYLWNNVVYAVHDNQVLDLAPPVYNGGQNCPQGSTSNDYCLGAGNFYLWNNTVECGDDSTQYNQCQSGVGVVGSGSTANLFDYENNHFITASTSSSCATGTGAAKSCTFASNNVVQTLAQANAQGYSSSEGYPFSPATTNAATVGAGTNLTLQATGTLTAITSDTTYACWIPYGTVPVCPTRNPVTRPGTGSWFAGAYQNVIPGSPVTLTGTVTAAP
jgi:hypothetical protein